MRQSNAVCPDPQRVLRSQPNTPILDKEHAGEIQLTGLTLLSIPHPRIHICEVDGAVGPYDDIVRTVKALSFVTVGDHLHGAILFESPNLAACQSGNYD